MSFQLKQQQATRSSTKAAQIVLALVVGQILVGLVGGLFQPWWLAVAYVALCAVIDTAMYRHWRRKVREG